MGLSHWFPASWTPIAGNIKTTMTPIIAIPLARSSEPLRNYINPMNGEAIMLPFEWPSWASASTKILPLFVKMNMMVESRTSSIYTAALLNRSWLLIEQGHLLSWLCTSPQEESRVPFISTMCMPGPCFFVVLKIHPIDFRHHSFVGKDPFNIHRAQCRQYTDRLTQPIDITNTNIVRQINTAHIIGCTKHQEM